MQRHLNLADVPWELDGRDGPYACDEKFVVQGGLDLAAVRVPPGKAAWPFHYHHANEELFLVLEGTGELRLGDERRRLKPHDVVSCPPGPAGAHQIINDGAHPLVYVVIGTSHPVDLITYPDSGKILVKDEAQGFEHVARLADKVPFSDG